MRSLISIILPTFILASCTAATVESHPLTESIQLGGQWLLNQEDEQEFLKYKYLPNKDRYSTDNNDVRKMGAAWALAEMTRFTGDERYRALAAKSIDYFRPFIVYDDGFSYVNIDDKRKLAYNAFLILILIHLDSLPDQGRLLEYLANGILQQQQENGEYKTYFYSERNTGTDYYPGEANLALATLYAATGVEKYLTAVEKSFPYYRTYWREKPTTAFIPWHTQAFALLYELEPRDEYRDFIFEMNDWLLTLQNTDEDHQYRGSFTRNPSISTSSYLEGLNDAYKVAKLAGDHERTAKYSEAIRLGNEFLLTLQYRPGQQFGLPELHKGTLGGFRQSPISSNIRVDNNQHVLAAFMKAVENGL